jgi:hypothetical protein
MVFGAPTETLTLRLEHNSTTQLEAPNKNHEDFTQGSFKVTSLAQGKFHEGWVGKNKSLG